MSEQDREPECEATLPTESDDRENAQPASAPFERPTFQHPDWMLGVVLIFALISVVAGIDNPLWLLIGSPFIIVLLIYVWARVKRRGAAP